MREYVERTAREAKRRSTANIALSRRFASLLPYNSSFVTHLASPYVIITTFSSSAHLARHRFVVAMLGIFIFSAERVTRRFKKVRDYEERTA